MKDRNPRSLGRALSVVTEMISVAGIGAYAVGLALNIMVFKGWGLNFLQLATISDTLTSGLDIFLPAIILTAAFFTGIAVTSVLKACLSVRLARVAGWAAVLVISVLMVWSMFFRSATGFMTLPQYAAYLFLMAPALVLSTAGWEEEPGQRQEEAGANRYEPSELLQAAGGLAFLLLIFVSGVHSLILDRTHAGFNGDLKAPGVCPAPQHERVMWVGERSIVIRCRARDFRVISHADNQTLSLIGQMNVPPGD